MGGLKASSGERDREEIARRGQEIYDQSVLPALKSEDENQFVAIDVVSAEFVVRPDDRQAAEILWARCPDAYIWIVRVGHRAACRLSWHSTIGEVQL